MYNPPTKVATLEIPYVSLVTKADPDFNRQKYREAEYYFTARVSYANPYIRGAYNRLSNTYTVGQSQGSADALVTAGLAPTVGNTTPGLYSGIPTGTWA